jgi:tripartite-type tricarboxylate transporter receptor subunit TctC
MTVKKATWRRVRATLSVTAALFLCGFVAPRTALAQYPDRAITILTVSGAGSAGDQIVRALAEALKKHLPQPMIVVNRAGASGTIAISDALAARPDGYTLGLGTPGSLTVQPHRADLPYGGPDTYTPVAKLVNQPNVLMGRVGAPWTTAQEFLNYARAHPGQVSVGVPGVASIAHLNIEQLKLLAKLDIKVAYFDGPQQVAAALLGQVDAALAPPGQTMPHVNAGKAVALGVFNERRLPLARDVPTFKELGFDITLTTGQAIIAPRGTPAFVVKTLDDAIRKAVAEPSFVSFAENAQNTVDYKGPEAFAAELRQSFEQNGELLRALGIKKN